MPAFKPRHATMSESAANFPNATSAPGACSPWGGPSGSQAIQPKYIPAKQAKRR